MGFPLGAAGIGALAGTRDEAFNRGPGSRGVTETSVIVGAQWGDEGKGKITDVLAENVDVVARFQGGNNAGHTVVLGDTEHALHLLPSGVLREDVTAVLGNGMVVDPNGLVEELDGLEAADALRGELVVSENAHVVFPTHKELDAAHEDGDDAIGTTKQGIGPAYSSKASRFGARLGELVDESSRSDVLDRVHEVLAERCEAAGIDQPDRKQLEAWVTDWVDRVEPHVADATRVLHDAVDDGRALLLEGAQGTLLDLDHGNYPYVTSSNPTAGAASTGTGLPPTAIDSVIGVAKAYTTRVGSGPVPTELHDEIADHLADKGDEYGTTTGRRRRVGWLDLPALAFADRINGFTHLALTKVDVLEGLDEVKVCTAYEVDGERTGRMPRSTPRLARAEPIYETIDGTFEGAEAADTHDELPAGAVELVDRVEDALGTPVALVSNGPERDAVIDRRDHV